MKNVLKTNIYIVLILIIFFACKKEHKPLVIEGTGLELKFIRNNENVSHEYGLDSVRFAANCNLTPSDVWQIEHRDTSLLFDIRSCCSSLSSTSDSGIYFLYKNYSAEKLDSFLFYKDSQSVECSITDAKALSPSDILEYTNEKITWIINE